MKKSYDLLILSRAIIAFVIFLLNVNYSYAYEDDFVRLKDLTQECTATGDPSSSCKEVEIANFSIKPACELDVNTHNEFVSAELGEPKRNFTINIRAKYSPFTGYEEFYPEWHRLSLRQRDYAIPLDNVKLHNFDSVEFSINENDLLTLSNNKFWTLTYPSAIFGQQRVSPPPSYPYTSVFPDVSQNEASTAIVSCDRSITNQRNKFERMRVEFDKPGNRLKRFFDVL